ncbi:hypothetical protein IC620_15030 [Hazenella sp. IB182357]|uniref:Uncharacterized protein n=1 Tax=Polycladospora coralii TaxID=2771432 RepID=A0A926NHI2_9BACL|nr:hypothetical protein [Polycladospora coralii]MBD1373659.1 hypothetical protein [Polycladospora coralii]
MLDSNKIELKKTKDSKNIQWFTVLQSKKLRFETGILVRENEWGIAFESGVFVLNNPRAYMYTLPLLEFSLKEIEYQINEPLKGMDINVNIFQDFPVTEVVRAGLDSKSEYWATLAMDWYNDFQIEDKLKLQEYILAVYKQKGSWINQKLYHRLKKEIGILNRLI